MRDEVRSSPTRLLLQVGFNDTQKPFSAFPVRCRASASSPPGAMTSHSLSFAAEAPSNVVYSLIELPSELLRAVEETLDDASAAPSMVIKGQPEDDAVLCTRTATHALRACMNSNSLLICQAVEREWDEEEEEEEEGARIEVLATLGQTLECAVTRARTERLDDLLGDYLWTGEEEERPVRSLFLFLHAVGLADVLLYRANAYAAIRERTLALLCRRARRSWRRRLTNSGSSRSMVR